MPKKLNSLLSKVTQAIIVLICIVVIYASLKYTTSSAIRLTPALRISYGWAYAAIPTSFLFVTIYEIRNLIVDLVGKGKRAAVDKPTEDLTGGSGYIEF
jgi:TRAP-type C4-dicarboxylate transport system permease small subunit